MEPDQRQVTVNGVGLALMEWPGADPPIVLAHATGFHARCWDQVIAHLAGRHAIAPDLRGHGRSAKPPPPYPWSVFGDDIIALIDLLGLRGAIGVGHSMGGHSLVSAAARRPDAFAGLLLIDPVILAPDRYTGVRQTEHFAARRRNEWPSPDEMYERFKDRPPFDRWQPAVLRDYCRYGLCAAPDGQGYVLACPPAIEADIYAHGAATNIYGAIAEVKIPVQLLRAGFRSESGTPDMRASPTAPDLVTCFARGRDTVIPDATHFIPMEQPARVADEVVVLERWVAEEGH